jgi:hypothetical protein
MTDALNFQPPVGGYGSYLRGILPDDQATAAGAFAATMKQINNVNKVDLPRFAQTVFSAETTANLPLINGTNVPTDVPTANVGLNKIALGSGPNGTYTMSNFFGCMSGLPYPLKDIQKAILALQTTKLKTIYQQLYLAAAWTPASASATITNTGGGYSLTNLTIGNPGGGYGRGGAPAPTIQVTGANGFSATATTVIGTDPTDILQYGKILHITITNPGTQANDPNPTIVKIQVPPLATLPVNADGSPATGGVNSPYGTLGWTGVGTGMDQVTQDYIDQANAEIQNIATISPDNANIASTLNTNYNATGTALMQEQRARFAALPPVPFPYNKTLNAYPTALYVFTDSLPSFSSETQPHMTVQTLENISDLNLVGGQSIIGAMRQHRNQSRLQQVGIPLTNNIPNGLTSSQLASLMLNTKTNANQPAPPIPIASYSNTAPKNLAIVGTNTPLPVVNGLAAANTLPILLNTGYTSSTISPAVYNVSDAINKVVECNCTCWVA